MSEIHNIVDGLRKKVRILEQQVEHVSLSTQQAADILKVSDAYVVQLIEAGAIDSYEADGKSVIYLKDLLEYRDKRDLGDKCLDELSDMWSWDD